VKREGTRLTTEASEEASVRGRVRVRREGTRLTAEASEDLVAGTAADADLAGVLLVVGALPVCVCVCVFVYIHTYIHTPTPTHTHPNTCLQRRGPYPCRGSRQWRAQRYRPTWHLTTDVPPQAPLAPPRERGSSCSLPSWYQAYRWRHRQISRLEGGFRV
jgi:hypothetical protein